MDTYDPNKLKHKLHIDASKYIGTIKEDQRGLFTEGELKNRFDAPIPMNHNTSLNKVLHIEKGLYYKSNENPRNYFLNREYSVAPGDKPWSGIP